MSQENEPQVPDENLEIVYKHPWYAARLEEDLTIRYDMIGSHPSPVVFSDINKIAMTFPFAKGINYLISEEEVQSWRDSGQYREILWQKSFELTSEFLKTDHVKTLKSTPEETYPLVVNYMREGSTTPWIICISFDERNFFICSFLNSCIHYPQFRNIDDSKMPEKSKEVLKLIKEIYEEEVLIEPAHMRDDIPHAYAVGSQFVPRYYFETHFPSLLEQHLHVLRSKERDGLLVPLPPELLPEGEHPDNPDDRFYFDVIESEGFTE